jgi:hypothetical protein
VTTRSSRPRPVLRRAVTLGSGLVAVALTATVATVALPAGLGTAGAVDDVQQVAAQTPERVLVCPAPVRLADSTQVGDAQFGAAPTPTTTVVRAGMVGVASDDVPVALTGLDGFDSAPLERAGQAGVVSLADVDAGEVLRVGAGTPVDTRVAASVGSTTVAGDLRGLAAASCTRPDIDQWIVGGSTEVGSSAQLVLQNPGRTPATVRLSVWGPGGPVVLSGGGQVLVPPGGEVVTLVEAAAPEQRRLAVRVEASGGTVAAYLQHSTLDGLVPLGVDHVVPGAAPAASLAVTFTSTGEAVDDPLAPQLRLLAPGLEEGTATITVYGPDGQIRVRGGEQVALAPGVVADQSMGGLPAGAYTVVVDATVPVVAAASEARVGDVVEDSPSGEVQVDRAWIAADAVVPPAPEAGPTAALDRGSVALVPGTTSVVRLGAVPAERSADEDPSGQFVGTLRAYGEDGTLLGEKRLTVPAGATTAIAAAELGAGIEPALLTLDAADEQSATSVWSVSVSAGTAPVAAPEGAPGSLVSVLMPVPAATSQGSVAVRVTRTAGLPD